MTDTGYSSQKTTVQITTATTTTSTSASAVAIGPDVTYIKTIPGILRIVEIVLNFICIICASVATTYHWVGWSGINEAAGFFEFVAVVGFIWTLIFFFLYFLKVVYVLTRVPWLIIDLILCAVWVVLYVIASIVAATKGAVAALAAAAFFGFCCAVVYGIDAFFRFRDWRSGTSTSTHVQSAHTDTKPPAY